MASRSDAVARSTSPGLLGVAAFGLLNLGLQIPYPLIHGDTRRVFTIWSVIAFFLFSVTHAAWSRGMRAGVALILVFAGGGLVAEFVGSHTGFPFGNYDYTSTLGWRIGGVPVIVPMAWAMMGWPALLAARVCFAGAVQRALYGAAILTSWDLMLDPQMVSAGHWKWRRTPGPWLHGIPVVNSLGWFAVAAFLVAVLNRLLGAVRGSSEAAPPSGRPNDLPVWLMLVWTWFSEWFGHIVFFGSPKVGVVGGIVMGAVLLPWARRVLTRAPRRDQRVTQQVTEPATQRVSERGSR